MTEIDMLCYLKLSDSSIMAACYTEDGIARLGTDYYIIRVGAAEIYNASGGEISLDELVRGCPIRIRWDGTVMESYPGQISARVVEALSDTPDPSVPAEEDIPPAEDGSRWWSAEPEPVTEIPDLMVSWSGADISVTAAVSYRYGQWSYLDAGEEETSGGAVNALPDGLKISAWTFDADSTIVRDGFDTISLSLNPVPGEMEVLACARGDETDTGTVLTPDEDGTVRLPEGDTVLQITARWDTETYAGYAVYGILVTDSSES